MFNFTEVKELLGMSSNLVHLLRRVQYAVGPGKCPCASGAHVRPAGVGGRLINAHWVSRLVVFFIFSRFVLIFYLFYQLLGEGS